MAHKIGIKECKSFGQELCTIFELDGRKVTNISVTHRVGSIPRLHVTCYIMDTDKLDAVKLLCTRYRLAKGGKRA